MGAYLKIYIKKNAIGHVRYEIGDGRGYKEIRGLSVKYSNFIKKETIYEKGEEDSHGISIYDEDNYLSSDEIPLEREELIGAMAYTKMNDEKEQSYNAVTNNCNDFTSGLLAAAGKKGCVSDYLSKEQKESFHGSQALDFYKCKIPEKAENFAKKVGDKIKEKSKEVVCNGIVTVGSYMRMGNLVEGYQRSCGRH